MEEIEILVKVECSREELEKKLGNCVYKGVMKTVDTYYYDPLRTDLKPQRGNLENCFRLRTKNNKSYITYKVDHFDGDVWQYSSEYETAVENPLMAEKIVSLLGFKELVVVSNMKYTYETPEYEIAVEDVQDLGIFLEVEARSSKGLSIAEVKSKILDFIKSLGMPFEEMNSGKPELLLRKKGFPDQLK